MSKVAEIATKVIVRLIESPDKLPCCPSEFNLKSIENCLDVCQEKGLDCEDCWREALSDVKEE